MSQYLAYDLISLADQLAQITMNLVGHLAEDARCRPEFRERISNALRSVDRVSERVADDPDLDRFYEDVSAIATEIEAIVREVRAGRF